MATATKKRPAKNPSKNSVKAKSTKPRPAGPDIPPAETPDLPPALEGGKSTAAVQEGYSEPDPTAALVDFLYNRGYALDRERWNNLTDAEQNNVRRWVNDLTHGKYHVVPPCMMRFDTNGGTRVGGGPLRPQDGPLTYFLACEFGRVSYKDTASTTVELDKGALTASQIEELLCGTKIGVLIELCPNDKRNDSFIPGTEPPRFEFICDSMGYRSGPKSWKFTTKFGAEIGEAQDLFAFAGRSGRIELTLLGEAEGRGSHDADDEDDDTHPDVEAGKDRPHGTPVLDAAAKARKKDQPSLLPEEPEADESADVVEFLVLPQTAEQSFVARVSQAKKKWRAGCLASFKVGDEVLDENSFPDDSKPGQTTCEYAITAVVDRWIGHLQKAPTGDWSAYIGRLQDYLTRLRAGETPEQIDAEITNAMGSGPQLHDPDDASEDDESDKEEFGDEDSEDSDA